MLKDIVKGLRTAKGWSQFQLAEKAGVSQQLITKIETGQVRESRKLPQIATALGISVEEMLNGSSALSPLTEKPTPLSAAQKRLLALWERLNGPGRRHILKSMEGEIARAAARPFAHSRRKQVNRRKPAA